MFNKPDLWPISEPTLGFESPQKLNDEKEQKNKTNAAFLMLFFFLISCSLSHENVWFKSRPGRAYAINSTHVYRNVLEALC